MLKLRKTICTVTAVLCLAAGMPTVAFADDEGYTEKEITAHVYAKDNIKTLTSRFYEELPQIPYVKVDDFYAMLIGKELEVEAEGNVFTLTNVLGETAVVDTDADTLKADDFCEFINATIYRQDGVKNIYYDGMPFTRPAGTEFDKEAEPIEIDFAGYGIDLKADGDDLWMPFVTANDLFKSVIMLNGYFDGEEYYFLDSASDYTSDETATSDGFISTVMKCCFKDGKRSAETARFGYGELCFLIDTFYGFPGRAKIQDPLTQGGSFDKALDIITQQINSTKTLKELLLSEDVTDYYAGLYIMHRLLYDGGHSSFRFPISALEAAFDPDKDELAEILAEFNYPYEDVDELIEKSNTAWMSILDARNKLWGTEKYHKQGSTVVYCFDSFMADFDGWRKYFAGNGKRPVDELSMLLDAMEKADNDPEVRNFVIDITCNGGGSGDIVAVIQKIIDGQSFIRIKNTISGQVSRTDYDIDANFDGVFDEKDNEKQYDLNFGILMSNDSFSCANLLPSLCKGSGIPLFGDTSGGGACAVYESLTADGLYFRLSSNYHIIDNFGNSVDPGIEPDYQMLSYSEDGSCDYSKLYDLKFIDEKMNEFYSDNDGSQGGGNPDTGSSECASVVTVVLLAGALLAYRKKR